MPARGYSEPRRARGIGRNRAHPSPKHSNPEISERLIADLQMSPIPSFSQVTNSPGPAALNAVVRFLIRFVDGTTYSFTGENGAHVVESLGYQTRRNLKARSGVAEA